MSKIRAVIFDCYSTLVDIRTNERKDEIFVTLAQYLGYYGASLTPVRLKSLLAEQHNEYLATLTEKYWEVDLEEVFKRVLRKEGLDSTFLSESCCKLLRVLSRDRFELFPDVLPVLSEIKNAGYPLALASNGQKVFQLEELRMLGLTEFFGRSVISTQFGFCKPDPRLFAIACALLQVSPAQSVYVGNEPERDVEGAKQAGMRAILVDRYREHVQHGARADYYANDLWQAWEWIRTIP